MWARQPSWHAGFDRVVQPVGSNASQSLEQMRSYRAQHRINNFDALRMMAALLVIWSHQFALMGLTTPLFFGNEPGAVGVVMFFAISGYLVSQSWMSDPDVRRFALRRALRIWPGLAVAVLLAVLVLGPLLTELPLAAYFRHPETRQHLGNLVLNTYTSLPGVFTSNPHPSSVNGPLWTIPLEVGCYVGLAVLGAVGVLRWRWASVGGFLLLTTWLQWRYRGPEFPQWSFALQYAIIFSLGATFAQWQRFWRPSPWATALIFLAACGMLLQWGPPILSGQAPLWALGGLAVIWGSCRTPGFASAGRFGDFSYGLYIYGFPVQQLVIWSFANQLSFPAAFALSVLGALALAVVSWHWVEKPALRWKPRMPTVS
ncbi:peptidoglycan/LPS O-acetylase OafA/YrhL [Acidovorax sp. 107]|nr:peptidoglycan/LPS O-acetylase OafA/YrhL [Acidovorax sp. 107]